MGLGALALGFGVSGLRVFCSISQILALEVVPGLDPGPPGNPFLLLRRDLGTASRSIHRVSATPGRIQKVDALMGVPLKYP